MVHDNKSSWKRRFEFSEYENFTENYLLRCSHNPYTNRNTCKHTCNYVIHRLLLILIQSLTYTRKSTTDHFRIIFVASKCWSLFNYILTNKFRSFSCDNHGNEKYSFFTVNWIYLCHIFYGFVTYLVQISFWKPDSSTAINKRCGYHQSRQIIAEFLAHLRQKLVYCTSRVYLYTLSFICLSICEWEQNRIADRCEMPNDVRFKNIEWFIMFYFL